MAFGYEAHPLGQKKAGAPTPFHHPPRPLPERSRTVPLAIPNAVQYPQSPPPLPPPKSVEVDKHDLGWHMANLDRGKGGQSESTPIRAGSSLLGNAPRAQAGKPSSVPERKIDLGRHQAQKNPPAHQPPPPLAPNSLLTSMKEEMVPASPPFPDLRQLMEYNKLQSEKNMSSDALRRSSQAYDQQLLLKIGGSAGQASPATNAHEPAVDLQNTLSRLNGQLLNLSGSGGAVGTPPTTLRSPLSDSAIERLPSFPRRATSAHAQTRPSTQHNQDSSLERNQTPGMAELSLQDRSPREESRAGQKRRAQSPPGPEPHLHHNSQQEPWQRNVMQLAGSRTPQTSRYTTGQPANSLSSVASSAQPNSYTSSSSAFSLSQPGTAATSYSSDRFSPSTYQHTVDTGGGQSQASVLQFHQGGLQQPPQQMHSVAAPTMSHQKTSSGILRAPGLWICDCCPKKPKKFESEEELRIHEMEKQYICQYCHNRFKNKNEAERHQNSLHLRRHSWSCAALNTFEAAFHPTPVNTLAAHIPGESNNDDSTSQQFRGLHATATDSCGYCGQEFINPPNWEDRIDHLNQTHKFGECNQSKKFFRADHFRQHLKHSHAGTSGKWTNMLEQACMKDEPPAVPLGSGLPTVPNAVPGGTPGIAMVGQQALLAAHQLSQQHRQAQEQAQHQAQQALSQPHGTPMDPHASPHFVNSDQSPYSQQFASQMQQVQQYQPEPSVQQGLNLAQHLQQAQREMAASVAPQDEGDGKGQEKL